ncbi:division/cell wall cluster transcriptional repressor MraZ [Ligilactobacillus equi]|uniref:Transcriptional regulator MraZ n=2 Tax=Ligilactobacillus equi TaxID=137357 RepID=V7I0E4_9LACO|nr:division/cell wall cluster transcriptional repressor MraZ [Ligilactobacillus equi]ETA74908.1 cell division protein MraZ [Ligilactobacillus equi DPC 6820]KRL85280.1 cell division protein MraZ [Ligilactobacillus equi DSM 15833 = JCM 10991]MCQ2556394.1 division/cell wall cluster transcriptional repressor MraZ [Ligilactobacillus sp.]
MMGEFQHNMDQKGRLIIPAIIRQEVGTQVVLTRGMDGCLYGYPASEWEKLSQQLAELPLTSKQNRAFVRFFYAAAVESEFDKQGRVIISQALRTYAGLEKECIVVGMFNHLEIWSKSRWDEFNRQTAASFDELAENMEFNL